MVNRACPEVQAAFLELMVLGKVCGEGHSRTGMVRRGSAVGYGLYEKLWACGSYMLLQPYSWRSLDVPPNSLRSTL